MDDGDAFTVLNSIGFGAERISIFHFVLPKPKGSRHGTKVEVRIHDYGPAEKRRFFVEAFCIQAIGTHPPGDRLGYGRGATLQEAIDLITWPDPDGDNASGFLSEEEA